MSEQRKAKKAANGGVYRHELKVRAAMRKYRRKQRALQQEELEIVIEAERRI